MPSECELRNQDLRCVERHLCQDYLISRSDVVFLALANDCLPRWLHLLISMQAFPWPSAMAFSQPCRCLAGIKRESIQRLACLSPLHCVLSPKHVKPLNNYEKRFQILICSYDLLGGIDLPRTNNGALLCLCRAANSHTNSNWSCRWSLNLITNHP